MQRSIGRLLKSPRIRRQPAGVTHKRDYSGIIYVLPALTIVAILVAYPTLETVRLSLSRTSGPVLDLTTKFAGLRNFVNVITSRYFVQVITNTLVWTIASVTLQYLLGLVAAVILNQPFRGRTVVRSIVMLPWAVPGIVVALTWRWMYHPDFGLINASLNELGLRSLQQVWLGQSSTALGAVVVATVWAIYPFATLMLLAGLQTVPQELLDAASIDGANAWNSFWSITFPTLRPVSTVIILLMTIWALNGFVVIYAMTSGGPGYSTEVLGLTIYRLGFREFHFDQAAAASVMLLGFTMLISVLYLQVLEREDR
jgi:multiple sugar transport system permease protein